MSKVLNLPERQDAEGTWHMITTWSGSQVVITTSPAQMMNASATPVLVWVGATTSGETARTLTSRSGVTVRARMTM